MPELDYHEQVAIKRNTRIRELLRELPEACSDYFRSIAQTTSALTRLAYAYDLRLFFQYLCAEQPDFAGQDIRTISVQQIGAITARQIHEFQDYLTQYIRSENDENETVVNNHELGIMRKLCCVRSFFEFLFKNEEIPANIATLVPLPKLHEKPILYLEPHEVEKMLAVADNGQGLSDRQKAYMRSTKSRDKAILMLFLGTGIRVSELVGMDLDDVDFSINGFVVTRKGGNQSILYFPETVADALQEYLLERRCVEPLAGHENAFFLSLQRRRITQRAVENLVKKYALVAAPLKKKISPHKLRSTFGTSLYQSTGDIYLVADVLGHADVNTTRKHYAAMTDQHKREAAKRIQLPVTEEKTDLEEQENG
ncbi:MAG: tyrosine-type recombinase/integrase [Peptococcaceae bacterium]|nr:tyrosine-type recombinase/integrase [Peptococcaceae bacterium]